MTEPGFIHRLVPGSGTTAVTLLLLHGTGGDEEDLLPLGEHLLSGAALLSPRGKVLENGMARFFRRLAPGIFDIEDMHRRTAELADFIRWATTEYRLDASRIVAVGYSNGANTAACLLLSHPGILAGAVLLRPVLPFTPDPLPDLTGIPVLIAGGYDDPLAPEAQVHALADTLTHAGATVTQHWEHGGHPLMAGDRQVARAWLATQAGR